MKQLNSSWIFSDSIKGHEVQSLALAQYISKHKQLYHCAIRQPWLTFAPRLLPRFGKNLIWKKDLPDINSPPDCIITCGRRMAAVGKHFSKKLCVPHIQILNPKDSLSHYTIVILPHHDQIQGKNVLHMRGSLHEYSNTRLNELRQEWIQQFEGQHPVVAIFIGHPRGDQAAKELQGLYERGFFIDKKIYLIGSRRSNTDTFKTLSEALHGEATVWLNESDGVNPYKGLLACGDEFFITADSINMISEVCATDKPLCVLSRETVGSKHRKFLESLGERIVYPDAVEKIAESQSIYEVEKLAEKVLCMLKGN